MDTIIAQMAQLQEQGKAFVLCIITQTRGSVPRREGSKMLVFADGSISGSLGGGPMEQAAIGHALQVWQAQSPSHKTFTRENENQDRDEVSVYFEPLGAGPSLYIFGAGHVGAQLARMAAQTAFRVILVDPRRELTAHINIPGISLQEEDYLAVAAKLRPAPADYIVITTHSHDIDKKLLEIFITANPAYLGMIGSKRKAAEVKKYILEKKTGTAEQLDKLDIPMGIPIKAETPVEIAISIMARLIEVKNTR